MDNVAIHCGTRIEEIITEKECRVKYLLSYLPDLNPIESEELDETELSIAIAYFRRRLRPLP